MRFPAWLVTVLVFGLAACGDKASDGACGVCLGGEVCDAGACRRVCNDAVDCGECEGCVGGVCRQLDVCDVCDACSSDQVCYLGSCMPACDPVDRSCQSGFTCIDYDGYEFCAPENGIAVKGGRWDSGTQESQSASRVYVIRGGLAPYGGRMSGGPYVVTDIQR